MRIALLNIDSVASNKAVRAFIDRHADEIVLLGMSPPFGRKRGSFLVQSRRHLRRSGLLFSTFLTYNFVIPRLVGRLVPKHRTLEGFAVSRGIRVERIDDINDPAVQSLMEELDVDLILSFYFDQIMGEQMITLPRFGVFNIHTSMLPTHRGPMPVLNGCLDTPTTLGVTLHRVDQGIDTGPIVNQLPYEPRPRQTVLELTTELHFLGLDLLEEALPSIGSGTLSLVPQVGGSYETFPDRATMRRLRMAGRGLLGIRDVLAALRTPATI